MTTIGYATLQIIPSIVGMSDAINTQLGGLKGEGRAAGKALGDGLAAGVGAAAQKVEQASKKVEAARNKEADAAGKLRTAEAQLETLREKGVKDAGRLTAAEEKIEKAKRDHKSQSDNLARSMKDEEKAAEKLTAAQKRLADSSQDAGDAVDGMFDKMNGASSSAGSAGSGAASSFMDGMTGGLAALGTRTGPIGAGIMAAVGLGLGAGALLAQNIMAGMEREVSQDRVQAQLGMSESQAAQFGQSTGKVYADNFGESLDDVGASMADVASTFPNVTGTALEDLTAKALTFRDVFGLEVPESVAAAQNLIVNGLAADGSQAFDLLTTSFQRVPAAMRDELPEILNEYATNFQSLGYSGEEAFGMLVAAAPRGAIVLDKIGDSLKEFTLLATDLGSSGVQDALSGLGLDGGQVANNILAGGDTAQTQFQQIVDGLLAIPDAGQQATAAIALFGTPLEDLDKSKIPQFLSSLDEAGTAMDGFSGSAQNMVDTVGDNTASAVESASRSWETAISNAQVGLAEAFGPQLEEWATWFKENGPQVTEFFSGVGKAAVTAGEFILLFVAETIGGMADLVNEFGDVLGGMATVGAEVFDFLGQGDRAREMREFAESSFGMADGLYEAEAGARAAASAMGDAADSFGQTQQQAQRVGDNVDRIAGIMASLPNGKQIDISAIVTYKDQNGLVIPPDQLRGFDANEFATAGDAQAARRGGFDLGGYTGNLPIKDIAGVVHGDEFVIRSPSQRSIEANHPGLLDFMNKTGELPGYQGGGLVDMAKRFAASVDDADYAMGGFSPKEFDCSGLVSAVANVATGRDPYSSRMSTVTAGSWLKSLGFQTGSGGPGDLRVGWWDEGGGANGHMAGTFPDGTNFESTTGGVRVGGPTGANSRQFTDHAFLPASMFGTPNGSGGDASVAVGRGSAAAQMALAGIDGAGGSPSASGGSGGGGGSNGFSLPSSFSDIGSAVGQFAGGQIGSALDVLGIPDSPGWLQGISQFVGGISISDSAGNSIFDGGNMFSWGQGSGSSTAATLPSVTPTGPPPIPDFEGEHGLRAGQRPGPGGIGEVAGVVNNWTINARDTEDAFVRAQRLVKERAAAKLDRF